MSVVLAHLAGALRSAAAMFWEVLWPLALGFLLSAVAETLVPKRRVAGALGSDDARSLLLTMGLGAASSSCSYAAVALARTLFRKGATFRNAIVFEFASTNLVFELGLVLLVLLGWQFLVAEAAGGVIMAVLLALLIRATFTRRLASAARIQAERGIAGRMEGHAAMDMSVTGGPLLRRALSERALTAVSHNYFMSVASVWMDVTIGFLVAGALAAWVPAAAWTHLFLSGHGALTELWGALIGPLVAMLSFVCSVGNVPLAAVLWRGGIGFAGAIAFIFGDLIIVPVIDIHRRYYGGRVSAYLLAVSYVSMACAGLLVSLVFRAAGAVPHVRSAAPLSDVSFTAAPALELNLVAIAVSLALLVHFVRTGGPDMLRHM